MVTELRMVEASSNIILVLMGLAKKTNDKIKPCLKPNMKPTNQMEIVFNCLQGDQLGNWIDPVHLVLS